MLLTFDEYNYYFLNSVWNGHIVNVRKRYFNFFPLLPQRTISISIILSSKTLVTSIITFLTFITWRGFYFKSEVSIDKDSKRGYLDERTGELSIIVVVEVGIFFTLLIWNSFLFKLWLLTDSFQYIESKISMVMD